MSNLVPMNEMQAMATSMIKSKMFGFKTVEEAVSIMLIAQAEGRHPALAARDYHVIQGRPALKADAMLARFQQEGGVVQWDEYTDTKVTGLFSHPKSCPKPVAITWTIEMAKRIGITAKDNWRNYPRAMLRARCISEGVRTVHPGIAVGIYTVEEAQDFMPEKDVTPTAGAGEDLTEEGRVKVTELADRVREWMNQGSLTDAYLEIENASLETDEKIYLWTHFDSRIRRQLKEEAERVRVRHAQLSVSAPITDAQKKRLEALIGGRKLGRDEIKLWCFAKFGKEHFQDLTKDEYNALDSYIEALPEAAARESTQSDRAMTPPPSSETAHVAAAPNAAARNIEPVDASSGSEDAASAAPCITADEALILEARCSDNGIPVAKLKAAAKVERLSQIEIGNLARAHGWIDAVLAKREAK